jgi:hypothetical protein
MTNYTRALGTTVAMILAGGANADLQYGDAILNAESNCITGSDQMQIHQGVRMDDMMEVNSSCGGGGSAAYLIANPDWFILSAGSTVPGQQNQPDDEIPIIVDGGNGPAAAEVQFTVDQPTLFRMSRCLEGSKVIFWDGDYPIAELDEADAVTKLPRGSYWATIETDLYGKPVWAEIDWHQQNPELDPADINGDGKVNSKDLAALVKLMHDAKPQEKTSTGGDCTDGAKSKAKGKAKGESKEKNKPEWLDGAKPMPKPKPGSFESSKGEQESKPWKGDDPITNYGDQLGNSNSNGNDFDGASQPGQSGPRFSNNGDQLGNSDSNGNDFDGTSQPGQSGPRFSNNGDLNNDGKVDIKDIVFLMGQL